MNESESITNDEVFLTSSTRLATALLSLGQRLRRPPCTRQVRRDGQSIVTFIFEPGDCGALAARWTRIEAEDPGTDTPEALARRVEWLRTMREENDEVKNTYANAAWRDLALMIVKATPRMVEIHGRDAMGFLREDATRADIRAMQRHL